MPIDGPAKGVPDPSYRRSGRPSLPRELAIGLATFALYLLVNAIDWTGRTDLAASNARWLFDLEQALFLDVEPALNRWLADQDALRVAANYEYAITYVVSAFGLLFWLLYRRPDLYCWARRSFVVLNLLAMTCFLAYPLMPPRLMAAHGSPGSGMDHGFVDTVLLDDTWGSWGSPLVEDANVLAAMPSLHLGWALWVSAVLAAVGGGVRGQVLSAIHVLVTTWVILATANHFVLDAVAVIPLVWLSLRLAGQRPPGAGQPLPAPDAFFLHAETATAPQIVGGVVLLDTTGAAGPVGTPSREEALGMLRARLPDLPRLRQRLDPAGAGLRRPRWRADPVDLDAHVEVVDVEGVEAFHRVVAGIAAVPLDRRRPLWRLVLVHGVAPDTAGLIFVVHHAVADGIGTVAQARRILDPYPVPAGSVPTAAPRPPGPLVRAAAIVSGLAKLAVDGRAPDSPRGPASGEVSRSFATAVLDLDEVRATARAHRVRVADVLLAATGQALRRVTVAAEGAVPRSIRVAVPLMVRDPSSPEEGNFTAAVMIDVPLAEMDIVDRLAAVARHSAARLRRPDRALASRFVLRAGGAVLPAPAFRAFARAVYGRPYFSAIVSNMPGRPERLSFLGRPIRHAFPLVPPAPGTPLALGALSWADRLCLGLTVDPASVGPAEVLADRVVEAVRELRVAQPARSGSPDPSGSQSGGHQPSASDSLRRSAGSSSTSPNRARS